MAVSEDAGTTVFSVKFRIFELFRKEQSPTFAGIKVDAGEKNIGWRARHRLEYADNLGKPTRFVFSPVALFS